LLFDYASGDWCVNLDGDDFFLDKDFIKKAVSLIDKDVILVFANQIEQIEGSKDPHFDKTGVRHFSKIEFCGRDVFKNYYKSNIHINHLSTIYRRSLAIKVGFYSFDILSSDRESFLKLLPLGNIKFCDTVAGVWRRHIDSTSYHLNLDQRLADFSLIENVINYHQNKSYLTTEELLIWKKNMILFMCQTNMAASFDLAGYRGFFKVFCKLFEKFQLNSVKSLLNIRILYRLVFGKIIPYRLAKRIF
jgi:glycosyltransferase involved in cell wall biosynthesis